MIRFIKGIRSDPREMVLEVRGANLCRKLHVPVKVFVNEMCKQDAGAVALVLGQFSAFHRRDQFTVEYGVHCSFLEFDPTHCQSLLERQ